MLKRCLSALLLAALLPLLTACGSRSVIGGAQVTLVSAERGIQTWNSERFAAFPVVLDVTNVSREAIGPMGDIMQAELLMQGQVFTNGATLTRVDAIDGLELSPNLMLLPGETVRVLLRFFPDLEGAVDLPAQLRITIDGQCLTLPYPDCDHE